MGFAQRKFVSINDAYMLADGLQKLHNEKLQGPRFQNVRFDRDWGKECRSRLEETLDLTQQRMEDLHAVAHDPLADEQQRKLLLQAMRSGFLYNNGTLNVIPHYDAAGNWSYSKAAAAAICGKALDALVIGGMFTGDLPVTVGVPVTAGLLGLGAYGGFQWYANHVVKNPHLELANALRSRADYLSDRL